MSGEDLLEELARFVVRVASGSSSASAAELKALAPVAELVLEYLPDPDEPRCYPDEPRCSKGTDKIPPCEKPPAKEFIWGFL